MKKLLFTCAIVIFAITVQAQFGFKAGVNMSTVRGEDWDHEDEKCLFGMHAGVFYKVKVSDNFCVVPELYYSTQGITYKGSGGGEDYTEKYILSYINLSFIARYNFTSGFYLGAGPQFGINTCAKFKEDGDEEDIKDNIKGSDIAFCARTGYETKSGAGFYARYNFGITDIGKDEYWNGFNSVFQVGFTYTLKGKKKSEKE